jgi:uncharacterized membrane protein HdeD (DUF308 family)
VNTHLLILLARNWRLVLMRGIIAILFGLAAFVWPHLTLFILVVLYGGYAFGDGLLALVAASTSGSIAPRWWLALVGLLGLAAGTITILYPEVTALVLLTFIGVAALMRGLLEIVGAIRLRREIGNEWSLFFGGVLSVLFGLFVLIHPGAGALAVVWLIAGYSFAFGLLLVAFSLRLRKHQFFAD